MIFGQFQISQCLNCHDFFSPTNIYSLCVLKGDDQQQHSHPSTLSTQTCSTPSSPNSRNYHHSSDHLIFVSTSNNIYVITSNKINPSHHQLSNYNNNNLLKNSVLEQTIHKDFPIQEIPIYNISRIPTDSQIISISAFRSHYDKSKIVLGVTFTQPISYNENSNSSKRKYDDEDDGNENNNNDDDHQRNSTHSNNNNNNNNSLYNEEYFSSSYDSAGGGDSTDEDSLLVESHHSKQSSTKKKKKKSTSSIIGKSFVSHSKMLKSNSDFGTITNATNSGGNSSSVSGNTTPNSGLSSSEQDTDTYIEQQQQQQQFNNYLYIYLLDEEEIFSPKIGTFSSNASNPNTPSANSTPSSTMTKHKCIQTFVLGYIPLGLSTQMVTLYPSMQQFPMFVLCGSDKSIHCFSDIIVQQSVVTSGGITISSGISSSGQSVSSTNIGYSLKLFDIPIVSNLFITNNGRIIYLNTSTSSSSNTTTTGSNASMVDMNTSSIMMNIPSSASRSRNFLLNDNLFVEYDFANCMLNIPGSIIDLDYKHNILIMGCQNGIVKGIQYSSISLSPSSSSFSSTTNMNSPLPYLEFQFMLNSPISSISILNYSYDPPSHCLTFIVGESIGRVVIYSIHVNSTTTALNLFPSNSSSGGSCSCSNNTTFTTSSTNNTTANNNNNSSSGIANTTTTNTNSTTTNTTNTTTHSFSSGSYQVVEEPMVIYNDEFGDSITCIHLLHYGESHEAFTEIYIGTYNKKLIVYQYDGESKTCSYKTTYHFEYPIYCIDSVDINNDGVKEIIVCTMYEIQILQPDLQAIGEYLKRKLLNRLKKRTTQVESVWMINTSQPQSTSTTSTTKSEEN
ncbi:hypothetical protein FDP41_006268 [Naegleria fowleri]|uniref:Uncharacterized protein n=1 Tax=Naegleria fowleri TaxID=5763 RepID=A0A6A5BL69_NAEFO|nr:uncharacterized protein FDP41_006268 [Naegleria fowleri]KAF0974794.1 hypothetical protein FDP41_006268 [Naegleria fowleri]